MFKNDTIIPFFSLVFAAVMFLSTYFDGLYLQALHGGPREDLSVGQIGLVAFGMVFLIYGLVGYLSVWLEGVELRPGHHPAPDAGLAPVVSTIVLSILLVALGGMFAQLVVRGLNERLASPELVQGIPNPALEGVLLGGILIVIAMIILIIKKFLLDAEVLSEDEHSEVPW